MSFTKTNFLLTNAGAFFLASKTPWLSAGCALGYVIGGIFIHKAVEKIFQRSNLSTPLKTSPPLMTQNNNYTRFALNPFTQGWIMPACEEIVFRQGLQNGLVKTFAYLGVPSPANLAASLLGASAIFSWAHVSSLLHGEMSLKHQILRAATTGFSGLLFGYAYIQGGIWASVGAHSLINSFLIIEDTTVQHFQQKARAERGLDIAVQN